MLLFDFYERDIRSIYLQMRETNLPVSNLSFMHNPENPFRILADPRVRVYA